jgi:hypothetical protein
MFLLQLCWVLATMSGVNSKPVVTVQQRRAAVGGLVRRLGATLRVGERRPIPQNAEFVNLTSGDEDAEDDSVKAAPEALAAALEISVADATRILEGQPLEVARELAARAATALSSVEPDGTEHFGRWLPNDRYSLDQVPCNLVEGDMRTYNDKGRDQHVWVAGSGKGDEGKRFCTLQLVVRFVDGDKDALYAGQPWPEICFRGQGLRITAKERAAWHPQVPFPPLAFTWRFFLQVWVRFQPKAWYDEATCLKYAKERFPTITADARRRGRESVLITDNLHGQTTYDFKDVLYRRASTKVHLLPGGVTDLIQLIDAGFGYLVKYYIGEYSPSL